MTSARPATVQALILQAEGGLGARPDRKPYPVGELRRHLRHLDVQLVLVIQLEHLWHQTNAHGVGLAGVAVDSYPHESP
jgi:hypothetical protein